MKKLSILLVLLMGLMVFAGCGDDGSTGGVIKYKLTVNVTDETGAAIEGAAVAIDGTEKTTDGNGVAQFDLKDGDYTVKVSADGYEDNSGSATIDGEDSSVDITLTTVEPDTEDFVLITSNSEKESDILVDYDHQNNIGNIASDSWGTGTTITPEVTYNNKPCWELTTPDSWGTVLAFMGDIYEEGGESKTAEFPVDLTQDSVINFSVATTGDYDGLAVKLVGENEKEVAIDGFDKTSTEWQNVKITTDQFSDKVDPAKVKQLAIIASGGTAGDSKTYVTDYQITNAEVVIPKPEPDTYTLTVNVADKSGVAIEGATATVSGKDATTNADGAAQVELPNGDYTVNVSADGYVDNSKSVTIDGAAKSVDVSLTSLDNTSALTVNVTNDVSGAAIEGAAVTVDGTEKTTDAEGATQFDLVDGDYTVNVSAAGYNDASQDVTIAGADKSIDIALTTDAPALFNSNFTKFDHAPVLSLQANYSVSTAEVTEGDSSIKAIYSSENDWGGVYVESSTAVDLSSYQGGNLVFDIKLPSGIADIGVKLDDPDGGNEVRLSAYTGTDAGNGWMTYEIPLVDFGIDLTQVTAGFGLWNPTDGEGNSTGGDVYIDNVNFVQ